MSLSLSFAELVNLALGTPELGSVNFNVLHMFLHGLLQHFKISDVRRVISADEEELFKPSASTIVYSKATEGKPVEKTTSVFHQIQDRVFTLEKKLSVLDDLPSSEKLLEQSVSFSKPVEDMWQMIQLQKKAEMNEAGVTKAMTSFQEMLTTFNFLKQTTSNIEAELGLQKNAIGKINTSEIEDRLNRLEEMIQNIKPLEEKLDDVQTNLSKIYGSDNLLQWSSLHDALDIKHPGIALSEGQKRAKAKEVLTYLGQIPQKYEELQNQVIELEKELRNQATDIANINIPANLLHQLQNLQDEIDSLQMEGVKDKQMLMDIETSIDDLRKRCELLGETNEKLMTDLSVLPQLQSDIGDLELRKMDREQLILELNVKADKRALDTKVGHAQLEAAMAEVNAIIEDLLKKTSVQDEWEKILEKLLHDMDSKIDRLEAESLRKDLNELWRIFRKHLSEGHFMDSDSAAGFKRKLFEKVKCVSCDRRLTMMTAPHLVTVRMGSVVSKDRPSSAVEPDYRTDDENSPRLFDVIDACQQSMRHSGNYAKKRSSKPQNLTTVYPYGDPGVVNYRNTEVHVMGVDGVIYKGRIDSKEHRNSMSDKGNSGMVHKESHCTDHGRDLNGGYQVTKGTCLGHQGGSYGNDPGLGQQGIKTPRPPSRVRSATPYIGRTSPPLTPSASRSRLSSSAFQQVSSSDIIEPEIRTSPSAFQRPMTNGEQVANMFT
ncbi:uncharacterized protein C16orf96 homolog isoform X1 [Microcaecilia unicolor]|uniref:Uncharacterized protein C16orf96 homolog isoform X1 n=1 Tax=Microcaecilia unicolor TaxID=1415580 RepID=A0A6P7YU99_9AMPH|nr:uncharacterized protein C16orf96 homolog isoform X1 [Microcaecilia unicolor]